jgi:hypothetical protein
MSVAPQELKPQVGLNLGALLVQLATAARASESAEGAEENAASVNTQVAPTNSAAAWRKSAIEKREAAVRTRVAKKAAESGSGQLFARAREVLSAVEEAAPGQGSYNMACLEAQLGNPHACIQWIRRGANHGALPAVEDMAADDDLAPVAGQPWFGPLMDECKAAAAAAAVAMETEMTEAGLD